MADRKVTVLNPLGYQELFQSGDNLIFDGSLNLQSNSITGLPAPGADTDGVNKKYVDDIELSLSTDIADLDNRVDDLEAFKDSVDVSLYVEKAGSTMTGFLTLSGNPTAEMHAATKQYADAKKDDAIAAIGDGNITFTATQNMSVSGSFTTNQSGNTEITLTGPDLAPYLQKPTADGSFVVVKAATNFSYSEVIDGGTY